MLQSRIRLLQEAQHPFSPAAFKRPDMGPQLWREKPLEHLRHPVHAKSVPEQVLLERIQEISKRILWIFKAFHDAL